MINSIRVAIVDDHAIVRQGLRTLLIDMDMDVVGEAANGDEAVTLAEAERPDVMLLDIRMKDCDGLSALPRIRAASPNTQVIILTTYSNPTYFSEAVRNGAAGYLLKESEPEDIVDAIQSAASHNHLFNHDLLTQVIQQSYVPQQEETAATSKMDDHLPELLEPISDREFDVLRLMAKGMSNTDIADELQVSVTTIKTHVTHIFKKLNANDRTQAVVLALRYGIVN